MDGWTILLAAVAALALVLTVVGWLWDRNVGRRRRRAMTAPPEREIPNFHPDAVVPEYLTELEARETSIAPDALALSAADRAEISAALTGAPSVPVGWVSDDFVTDPAQDWATAPRPLVLVCADPVRELRELYPVLEVVGPAGRPLVLVAPELAGEVLETLQVNHLQGNLRVIAVLAVATQLDQVAEFVGAAPVSRVDLMSGYLAPEALGECAWWVSSRTQSWIIGGGPPLDSEDAQA